MARSEVAQPYLTLDRYRQIINEPMCFFNGVTNPNENTHGCNNCWSQWDRDRVAEALLEAEQKLASYLNFWLGPHYLTDYNLDWYNPVKLKWGYVVGGGVQGLTAVTPTASDFTTDPATITVAQSDFPGGTDEIYIIETSTNLKIIPDKVTTTGVSYVISISQCKLIEYDDLEYQDADSCIAYNAAFPAATWLKLADLTVYREYLDTSDQATVTFINGCDCWSSCTACDGTDYTACVYVLGTEISKVQIHLADYDATTGDYTCTYPSLCGCIHGSKVSQVNYLAGTTSLPGWERAVVSLAHTLLTIKPCGCDSFKYIWDRDTRIPERVTVERLNCPFGEMDGAWYAWKWMMNNKNGEAIMLGGGTRQTRNEFIMGWR